MLIYKLSQRPSACYALYDKGQYYTQFPLVWHPLLAWICPQVLVGGGGYSLISLYKQIQSPVSAYLGHKRS